MVAQSSRPFHPVRVCRGNECDRVALEPVQQRKRFSERRRRRMAQATAVATEAEFQVVSIEQVGESKTNPRKHFAKDALLELTNSVREKGVLVPLLVRRVPAADV